MPSGLDLRLMLGGEFRRSELHRDAPIPGPCQRMASGAARARLALKGLLVTVREIQLARYGIRHPDHR